MALGKWRFHAGLWPTLAMLLLCALFLRLALWQWDRAEYKRGLLKAYAEQAEHPPVDLDTTLRGAPLEALPPYLKVTASGRYDSTRQVLLEDMTHDSQVGYEVLTPFLMEGGGIVLVDRGWLPRSADGKKLPDVAVAGEPRTVSAVLGTLPVPGLRLGKAAKPAAGWPKVLFYPTLAELTPLYGPQLLTPVLHLDPGQPDGYARALTLDVGFPPERHLAYAFQWVLLAAAVFAVWLVVNLHRRKREEERRG